MEASRSLGISYGKTMRKIILPQATKLMLPNFVNQFVIALKDTTIVSAIGLVELFQTGKTVSYTHLDTLDKPKTSWIFNFVLALVHALAEVLACVVFYATSGTNVENMFYVLFVLVGFGTIIHSMVDYTLALAVYKVLRKRR